MTKYYHHDHAGIYLGSSAADPDPRNEGAFMPPPYNAVLDAPPDRGSNQAARRIDGAWVLIPDFRGREYWSADRTKHVIVEVGIQPPTDALDADPGPTAAELWANHQDAAQAALDSSDRVAVRCMKAGVLYPAEWLAHDNALRAIVRAATGDPSIPLPTRPVYPAGT